MEIDLVYLWVDSGDPEWLVKKNEWLVKDEKTPANSAVAKDCQFVSNDELRYSLRSVELFAPWVRRIHIVTDDQVPEWLDTSHPKIHMVSHRDIMPADILPTFNSSAMEFYLQNIEGLSEHFIFANDDMLFAKPVTPGFFFDGEGRPIVRLKEEKVKKHASFSLYANMLLRMQGLVRKHFGRCTTLAPHHNIDAYTRTMCIECRKEFEQAIAATSANRFRTREDMHRSVIGYYALATGRAVLRKVSRHNGAENLLGHIGVLFGRGIRSDSRCIPNRAADCGALLRKYRPTLFCINDSGDASDADRARAKAFLAGLFPEKCGFER